MQNNQPIEKRVEDLIGTLEVHSIFHTIQGEGPFCGEPAVFVRLAGCNLQCPQCDTDYTSQRRSLTPLEVLAAVQQYAPRGLVVITGGEPFRQYLPPLLKVLVSMGYYVQIETNGTLEPPQIQFNLNPCDSTGVYIVCSPKAGKVHGRYHFAACAFKYVISHDSVDPDDGLPVRVLDHSASPKVARPGPGKLVYLQPADVKDSAVNQLNIDAAVASCMKYGYTLQLQIHKIIGME